MPGYDQERYQDLNDQLINGEIQINISATCMVYKCINCCLKLANEDLRKLISSGKALTYSDVRKFVVDFYNLDMADFILYSAFRANKDQIWYQDR